MQTEHLESRFRVLPDVKICRTESMGIDYFTKCLVEHPEECSFAMFFGYSFFCRHPDREKLIRSQEVS